MVLDDDRKLSEYWNKVEQCLSYWFNVATSYTAVLLENHNKVLFFVVWVSFNSILASYYTVFSSWLCVKIVYMLLNSLKAFTCQRASKNSN